MNARLKPHTAQVAEGRAPTPLNVRASPQQSNYSGREGRGEQAGDLPAEMHKAVHGSGDTALRAVAHLLTPSQEQTGTPVTSG